jgi:predicted nucleic acid-binding protein
VKVFFDTNVLLDGYYKRAGHDTSDEAIERCRVSGPYRGLIAWHTISNIFYLVRSHSKSTEVSNRFIIDLLAWVEVAETGKHDALSALEFGMKDFEDALQLAAAVACDAEVILTRNTTDFKASPIPVMNPEEFLASLAR